MDDVGQERGWQERAKIFSVKKNEDCIGIFGQQGVSSLSLFPGVATGESCHIVNAVFRPYSPCLSLGYNYMSNCYRSYISQIRRFTAICFLDLCRDFMYKYFIFGAILSGQYLNNSKCNLKPWTVSQLILLPPISFFYNRSSARILSFNYKCSIIRLQPRFTCYSSFYCLLLFYGLNSHIHAYINIYQIIEDTKKVIGFLYL